MKVIKYATQNYAKVKSLERVLSPYDIKVVHAVLDLTLSEPRINIVELVAREKVKAAFEVVKEPVVALDAGFFIPSLKGFPGVFVNHVLDTIGVEGILKLIEGGQREGEFQQCLAFYDGKNKPTIFKSIVFGLISEKPKGTVKPHHWSVLATVFSPLGEEKTLAEMTDEEYLRWSAKHHQNSYATKFAEWFLKEDKNG